MNFGLNSVNFRNVKRKIRFGPHRNERISLKFRLIRSNPRTLAVTGVERFHEAVAGVAGPKRGGGREQDPRGCCCRAVAKVSQQRGPPVVVLAEPAAEATVREDAAAPAFADQGARAPGSRCPPVGDAGRALR
jgi:hypothetical protein